MPKEPLASQSIFLSFLPVALAACSVTTELGATGAPAVPNCGTADVSCTGCLANHSCASGICDRLSATCHQPEAIAYVAQNGVGDACTQTDPCGSLAAAAAVLTPTRRAVLVAPGIYGEGAAFDHAFPVEIYGEGAIFIGGQEIVTISAHGAANVAIAGIEVSTQGTAFSCRDGATLSLQDVRVQSDLGVAASQCELSVRDAAFYDGGYAIVVKNDVGEEGHRTEIAATTFNNLAAAIIASHTALTVANVAIENVDVGMLIEALCPDLGTCVTISDSIITGASTRAVELKGSGFLLARNQVIHNPSGGVRATGRVLRIESNVIAHNGGLAASSGPGILIDDAACFGCTRQIAIVGNTVANNYSSTSSGAGILSGANVAPVLASNIVAANTSMFLGGSQIQCHTCTSYQDLVEPATVGGVTRMAPVGGDPKFIDAPGGNFRVQPTSPAQGAGMCLPPLAWMASIASDVDGHARNQPCDIGAYEMP